MQERTNPGPPPERPPFSDATGTGGMSAAGEAADIRQSATSALADPRALQILSTEHWSLLATRSLSYNEAFTRAGMFLTALSASMVAIAFVAQADRTGTAVPTFTIILLAFDLFVGLTTYFRLVETTREDLRSIQGMNRIRHAYLEMVPGLTPYFVSSDRDDLAGILMTYEGPSREDMMAGRPGLSGLIHGFSTNTGMVAVVVSLVGAALAGVAIAQLQGSDGAHRRVRRSRLRGAAGLPSAPRVRLDVRPSRPTRSSISRATSPPVTSVAGGETPEG